MHGNPVVTPAADCLEGDDPVPGTDCSDRFLTEFKMAIYMKLGSAKGDVTEAGHVGQVELIDLRWSMSRTIRSAVGVGTNRESTSAYVSELTVTKYVDSASSNIAQNAFVGETQTCQIDFTRVSKGQEAVFRSISLTDAIISGLVNSGSSSDRPVEVLTLNFTVIAITDTDESETGTAGSNSTVTYDLTKAQTS
jgi:type VI secretion system secreted protein Hcp